LYCYTGRSGGEVKVVSTAQKKGKKGKKEKKGKPQQQEKVCPVYIYKNRNY
jgi:hypothetical protein